MATRSVINLRTRQVALVIRTTARHHIYKDILRPPLERHSRAEKNPTMTKIVLLWLISKTILIMIATIVGHVPQPISIPRDLFLKKGGTISCVVTGPRQPVFKRSGKATV